MNRKLNPPIPTLKTVNLGNLKPKIFDEINSPNNSKIDHFNGWSFVNSEENK